MANSKKYLSKFTLPSGEVYYLKDQEARELIASVGTFIVTWDGIAAPDISKIPEGVSVTYNDTAYIGTLSATDDSINLKAFYLVKTSTVISEQPKDIFDEYAVVDLNGTKTWEKLGDTTLNLSGLKTLAYKDNVILNKGISSSVLGGETTFTTAASPVSFSGGSTKVALGANATFETEVSSSKNRIKATATASGTALSTDTSTFVKSYPGQTNKLEIIDIPNVSESTDVQIPNVTNSGTASSWSFTVDETSETLIITGSNGTAPSLGTPITASKVTMGTNISAATGNLSTEGTGATVMIGLGTPTVGTAITSASVATQPTVNVSLATSTEQGGTVEVVTGISEMATTTVKNADSTTAITSIGTATAAAQQITVGTNNRVDVANYEDLSVSVL